jgi:hypothetical protein
MIAQRTAQMIAVLSGFGGFLACLALHMAARGIFSSRRSTTAIVTGLPSPQPPEELTDPEPSPSLPTPPSGPVVRVIRTTQQPLDWKERDERLVGTYKVGSNTFIGYVKDWQSQDREFYIVSPPETLRTHPYVKELAHRGQGRYLITFTVAPSSALAGVRGIEQMLTPSSSAEPHTERTVVRPIVHRARTVVRPKNRLYWQLRDWEVDGNRLVGNYQTRFGSFAGYIEQRRSPQPEFFIVNPPEQLMKHPHWICFSHIGGNTFSIHFDPRPTNPSGGIREVEKVLAEALKPRRRRS